MPFDAQQLRAERAREIRSGNELEPHLVELEAALGVGVGVGVGVGELELGAVRAGARAGGDRDRGERRVAGGSEPPRPPDRAHEPDAALAGIEGVEERVERAVDGAARRVPAALALALGGPGVERDTQCRPEQTAGRRGGGGWRWGAQIGAARVGGGDLERGGELIAPGSVAAAGVDAQPAGRR